MARATTLFHRRNCESTIGRDRGARADGRERGRGPLPIDSIGHGTSKITRPSRPGRSFQGNRRRAAPASTAIARPGGDRRFGRGDRGRACCRRAERDGGHAAGTVGRRLLRGVVERHHGCVDAGMMMAQPQRVAVARFGGMHDDGVAPKVLQRFDACRSGRRSLMVMSRAQHAEQEAGGALDGQCKQEQPEHQPASRSPCPRANSHWPLDGPLAVHEGLYVSDAGPDALPPQELPDRDATSGRSSLAGREAVQRPAMARQRACEDNVVPAWRCRRPGDVAERSKAAVLKTAGGATPP